MEEQKQTLIAPAMAINADEDEPIGETSVDYKLNDERSNSMLMRRSTFFSIDNKDVKEALEADCKEMKIINVMVGRPCLMLCVFYALLLLITIIVMAA